MLTLGILLLALLVSGSLVAAVAMLAFRKTRAIGIAVLVVLVLGVVLLVPILGFRVASEERQWRQAADIRVPPSPADMDVRIPVEAAQKTEAKPPKPVSIPPAPPANKTNHAPAAASAEKKPPAATAAKENKPPLTKPGTSPPAETPAAAPPKNSPAWVDQPPRMLGDTYQTTLVIGPYSTRKECDDALPGELQEAVNSYVETHLGLPARTPVALPYEFLRDQLVKDQWQEIRPSSVGPMTRLHVLLQFDRKLKERVLEQLRRDVVAGRLWLAGGGLVGLLWLLAVLYGYLRIDLNTAGAYRRRLRFAAALAILGPVAAALLAAVVK